MATHKPINILEAFAAAPPPLDYVLPNMVAGTVGALVSPGGAGKSMLALQLAAQIAGGPDLLEVGELPTGPVKQQKALPTISNRAFFQPVRVRRRTWRGSWRGAFQCRCRRSTQRADESRGCRCTERPSSPDETPSRPSPK